MCEIWKEVSVNSNYEISILGNIRNKNTKKILKPNNSNNGYLTVTMDI